MPPDTERTLTVEGSPRALALLALLGVGMTALSVTVAIPLLPNVAPGSYEQSVGWIGVVFFAVCTAAIAWRAATLRGPVVILSPDGIVDVRVSHRPVPWPAVEAVGTWHYSGQTILVLGLSDAAWQAAEPTRIARATRAANARLKADGYCITTQGLRMDFETLRSTVIAYADAHH